MSDLLRRFGGTAKRKLAREVSGTAGSLQLAGVASPLGDSPVRRAMAREHAEAMNRVLCELPKTTSASWSCGISAMRFTAIGQKMGRTPEAARKLWCRAPTAEVGTAPGRRGLRARNNNAGRGLAIVNYRSRPPEARPTSPAENCAAVVRREAGFFQVLRGLSRGGGAESSATAECNALPPHWFHPVSFRSR